MRFSIASLSSLLLLQALAAQTPVNNRHLFFVEEGGLPNRFLTRVNAATRVGGANTAEVECLVDVNNNGFRGVGAADPTTCNVTGQVYVIQDQDSLTASGFRLMVRSAVAPNGLPNGAAAGIIATSGVINTPTTAAGGAAAWAYSTTWTTPVVVPCEAGYFVGVVLLPQASATDYVLTQSASVFSAGATPPTTSLGDNPVTPTPLWHACRVDQPAGTATRTTSQRTLTVVSLTSAATMNIGNVDSTVGGYTSYGLGGLYPAIKGALRDDGLSARVEDESNVGGVCAVFLSTGFSAIGGLPIGGIGGALWIDPAVLIQVAIGGLPAASPVVFTQTFAPPGSIPAAPGRTLTFTALTFGAAGGRLTNAQAVTL